MDTNNEKAADMDRAGELQVERRAAERRAAPAQQTGDVRDLMSLKRYGEVQYEGFTEVVNGPYVKFSDVQALARPSAALTDSDIEVIGREWAKEPSHFEFERNDFIGAVKAILAASGGAHTVPEGYK